MALPTAPQTTSAATPAATASSSRSPPASDSVATDAGRSCLAAVTVAGRGLPPMEYVMVPVSGRVRRRRDAVHRELVARASVVPWTKEGDRGILRRDGRDEQARCCPSWRVSPSRARRWATRTRLETLELSTRGDPGDHRRDQPAARTQQVRADDGQSASTTVVLPQQADGATAAVRDERLGRPHDPAHERADLAKVEAPVTSTE